VALLSNCYFCTSKALNAWSLAFDREPIAFQITQGRFRAKCQLPGAKCSIKETHMQNRIALLSVCLLILSALACAQKASPAASADCKFSNGKTIHMDYSSPRAKGRKILGGLVPYGQVWRAGADDATTFVTTANLSVGGKDVPAGSYTIFAIPNPAKWTLIVNQKTGEWGIPYKYEADDLARVDMNVAKTSAPVENFTISFDQTGGKCTMRMEWENTRASVDIMQK
jgi:Protein of unknown function (DUF2911)